MFITGNCSTLHHPFPTPICPFLTYSVPETSLWRLHHPGSLVLWFPTGVTGGTGRRWRGWEKINLRIITPLCTTPPSRGMGKRGRRRGRTREEQAPRWGNGQRPWPVKVPAFKGEGTWTMNLSLMTLKDWRLGRGTESSYNWDWILWCRGKKFLTWVRVRFN